MRNIRNIYHVVLVTKITYQPQKIKLKFIEHGESMGNAMIEPQSTQFAPAERESDEIIGESAAYFAQQPWISYLIDALPDVMLILNDKRQAVYVNTALLNMMHMNSVQDVLGQRPGELVGCVHAHENDGGCGTAEACEACGAVQAVLVALRGRKNVRECRITRMDGEPLDLRVWATPIEAEGKPYVIMTMQDISDEKRRRVLERIFFHDIMNTAGVISSYAHWLEMTPDDASDLIAQVVRSTDQLVEEIRAQRDLMAAENGELSIRAEDIVPQYILITVADQYRRHPVANKKTIRVMQSDDTTMMCSDAVLLGRVLGNMVKNALEASQAGEEVSMGFRVHGDEITFWVHNPKAMPRPVQLQIFQRSFSTKGKGRGLGTYSMKLITEKYLGGTVRFESSKEDGTTFFATYPLMWERVPPMLNGENAN